MATKRQLHAAAGELVKAAQVQNNAGKTAMQMLRSCRLQFQNPATFEVTAVYLTRTDVRRYRVKIFRGGKCIKAEYVEADNYIDVLNNVAIEVFNQ